MTIVVIFTVSKLRKNPIDVLGTSHECALNHIELYSYDKRITSIARDLIRYSQTFPHTSLLISAQYPFLTYEKGGSCTHLLVRVAEQYIK